MRSLKALLFLGAGSVIHAMSGEQDMRKMGGIYNKIWVTYILMWIGSLALAGIPFFMGSTPGSHHRGGLRSPHGRPVRVLDGHHRGDSDGVFIRGVLIIAAFHGDSRADSARWRTSMDRPR